MGYGDGGGGGQGGRGHGGGGFSGQQGPGAPVGAATPRYTETDDVRDKGDNNQVVGWVRLRWVESEAMVQGVKGGVEVLIPEEVSDDVMDNCADDLGVVLDAGVAKVLGVEDVDCV